MVDGIRQTTTLSVPSGPVRGASFMAFGVLTGSYSQGLGYLFPGDLDEVRVWGTARTQQDILGDMNRQLSGSEPGLLGYWNFNECSGQMAHDLGPYAKHATLGPTGNPEAQDPVWVVSGAPLASPPSCTITFTPPAPGAGDVTAFDSHATDPDGTVVSADWSFGDGTTSTGLTTIHTYTEIGTYAMTCTVTDNDGLRVICSTSVTVTVPKTVSLPTLGWYMIAQPHHGNHPLSSVRVRRTDTGEELPFCDAWLAGWVQATLYWYDHNDPGYKICSCDVFSEDDTLRQGMGYFMCADVDGIELIFP